MEDLILALVTFVASIFIFSHAAHAGMDAFVIVAFVASMPLAGYLAYERERSQRLWVCIAAAIGPLAIPLLYFVSAVSSYNRNPPPANGQPHSRQPR